MARIIFRARWSRRRPTWGDNYCLQFTMPWGESVGIGAPTVEQARDYAQSEWARLTRDNYDTCILSIPPYRGYKGA